VDYCDVLIVGGGPAGSTCADRLRRGGASALLLDQKLFPRNKPCAGWITPPVVDLLRIDVEWYRRERIWQPIHGFRTGLIGGGEVETIYDRPVSYGIRRCEFDHYLLQRSGADCRLGEPVKTIERRDDHWIVNGSIQARLIVGAGGHFCPVAHLLGRPARQSASVVAAQEIEFAVDPSDLDRGRVAADMPELFFCDDLEGYGWCFRKGNFLNIGLGRTDPRHLGRHVAAFCDFLRQRRKVCCEIPTRFQAHAYRLYERTAPKLLDDGVLLIGDSAGLAYPQSGEGIRPAVESGLLAADVILAAAGDFRRERLEAYRTRIAERFGRPRSGSPARWLPAGWLHFLSARLLATHWFSRHVLLDRWFLHSAQSPLAI
jgi:geranylgeranyl reductase family protein